MIGEAEHGFDHLLPVRRGRGVSGDRAVRVFPPRQRAPGVALLPAVPGVVRAVRVPLFGQAESVRQVHLLRQRAGGDCRAHAVPAFLLHLSGATEVDPEAPAAALLYLPGLALALLYLGAALGWMRVTEPLIEVRWALDRIWMGFLCAMYLARRRGAGAAAAPRRGSDRAQPVDVAAQRRRSSGVLPFTVCLRGSVRRGCAAEPHDEPGGAAADAGAGHLGLRDSALPPDGRR